MKSKRWAKALVTGGGGFIGGHLSEALMGQGCHVTVADNLYHNYRTIPYYHRKLQVDLRDPKTCLKVTKGMDMVFNLAAFMGGMGLVALKGADIAHDNVMINANIANACNINKVKRLFFSSSACVYPEFLQETLTDRGLEEKDAIPAAPDTYYGWEKLFTERMLDAYHKDYGLEVRIARFHNIYGPWGTFEGGKEKAPAALCRKIALAKPNGDVEVWGDGQAIRSYCYVTDCVRGIIDLTCSDFMGPVNLGSTRGISVDDLAYLIANQAGKKINLVHIPGPQGVRGRNANISLAMKELNWIPKVDLEEGMGITYNWIKEMLRKTGRTVY